jgi:hypothetical protein
MHIHFTVGNLHMVGDLHMVGTSKIPCGLNLVRLELDEGRGWVAEIEPPTILISRGDTLHCLLQSVPSSHLTCTERQLLLA